MPVVKFEKLNKSFGPVRVLTDLNLTLNRGEIVALMGENGAGKSTLMKILSGVWPYGDYEGDLFVHDKKVAFRSPKDSEELGIATIHQELSFFAHLTVAENLFVGRWPAHFGAVDWGTIEKEAQRALDRVGAHCRPSDLMKDLRVGEQQLVEIAKALYRKSQVLILDEPTSALSPRETERLFHLMLELKNEGVCLVYISHKMDEIFQVSDRIVVLRDGSIVGDALKEHWTNDELVKRMVGRDVTSFYPEKSHKPQSEPILEATDFEVFEKGKQIIGPISFKVQKGEVFGLAGLLGAGRTEVMKALFGDEKYEVRGFLRLHGKSWSPSVPQKSLANRMFYVSEDRKRESLLKKRSLEENVRVSSISLRGLFTILSDESEVASTDQRLKGLRVRHHHRDQDILELSGGNQQKVILARCLEIGPDLILLDEPTRGVDVGAKHEIYQLLMKLVEEGRSIIVASSEMNELMGICDRIMVLKSGKSMGILGPKEWSSEAIGARAFGHVGQEERV